MARLRPAHCYRKAKRPYTRVSKYKKKSFVTGVPGIKVVKFVLGNKTGEYDTKVYLVSDKRIQIRHNALESARLAANRFLEKDVGRLNYTFRILVYPHHVIREHPIAGGAGADRYSSGMAHSFGKAISRAAQVKPGQKVLLVITDKANVPKAKIALKRANSKLPIKGRIIVLR